MLVTRGWLAHTWNDTGAKGKVTDWSTQEDTMMNADWLLVGVHRVTETQAYVTE